MASAGHGFAHETAVKRTEVRKEDGSVPGREAVIATVEIPNGQATGRHTHPGDEISYVLEGQAELTIDGGEAHVYKQGEAYVITQGKVHSVRNVGPGPLKLVAVSYVVKGLPIITPIK